MTFTSASKETFSSYSPKRAGGGGIRWFFSSGWPQCWGCLCARTTLLVLGHSTSVPGFPREDPVSERSRGTRRAKSLPNKQSSECAERATRQLLEREAAFETTALYHQLKGREVSSVVLQLNLKPLIYLGSGCLLQEHQEAAQPYLPISR